MRREPTAAEGAWGQPEAAAVWEETWHRYRANRMAVLGTVTVLILALLALAAPVLTDLGILPDPYQQDVMRSNQGFSLAHPVGTDYLGRDLLSRTVYGARVSLSVGILLQAFVFLVGGGVGLLSGYCGGWVDNLLMRFTDAVYAFPTLLFVLVIAAVVGPGYWNIFFAIGAVSWVELARIVRGQTLYLKQQDYVRAARASGSSEWKIVSRHIVPNSLGPVIVVLTFGIPAAIFIEAFLSFLGVGVRPPTPSWGIMIRDGYLAIFAYPAQVLVPALAVSLATVAFNFVGDGLRDALDPRLRR